MMDKKIVAVNAGPRMGWNTETLITEGCSAVKAMLPEASRISPMSRTLLSCASSKCIV